MSFTIPITLRCDACNVVHVGAEAVVAVTEERTETGAYISENNVIQVMLPDGWLEGRYMRTHFCGAPACVLVWKARGGT